MCNVSRLASSMNRTCSGVGPRSRAARKSFHASGGSGLTYRSTMRGGRPPMLSAPAARRRSRTMRGGRPPMLYALLAVVRYGRRDHGNAGRAQDSEKPRAASAGTIKPGCHGRTLAEGWSERVGGEDRSAVCKARRLGRRPRACVPTGHLQRAHAAPPRMRRRRHCMRSVRAPAHARVAAFGRAAGSGAGVAGRGGGRGAMPRACPRARRMRPRLPPLARGQRRFRFAARHARRRGAAHIVRAMPDLARALRLFPPPPPAAAIRSAAPGQGGGGWGGGGGGVRAETGGRQGPWPRRGPQPAARRRDAARPAPMAAPGRPWPK